MIDLILATPPEEPATLFTRNFRVHSGIPIGMYEGGERAPVALLYGDISEDNLRYYAKQYAAIIAMPYSGDDAIPEDPRHYEYMTVKAPILARVHELNREDFTCFVRTYEGGPLVLEGMTDTTLTMLFTADLVRATIRILSGELELETGHDRFGRHQPAPESVISSPGVSFHFNLIEQVIHHVYRRIGLPLFYIPRWPRSASHALFLSHDLDNVRKWTIKRSIYELMLSLGELCRFKPRRLIDTAASLGEAMRGRDPYWIFDDLLFMESGNGFKSTWFFAPIGDEYRKRERDIDPIYHRKPAEITAMIRRIVESGNEFGLHGTRKAFLDARELRRQLDAYEHRIGLKIQGVRHHYLMFRHGKTLEAASEARLLYDTTLGFSDRPGFRNGMAAPFFPFPVTHEAGGIIEIPLNFMDGVFLQAEDNPDGASRRITEAYLYARAAGGLFSVLVHPGNMDRSEIPTLATFYQSFLSRCRLDNAISMTGLELARWWTVRERILRAIEFGDDTWRIRGIDIPEDMDFAVMARDIKKMKISVGGVKGSSELNHERVIIRPEIVDPERGLTFSIRK